MKKLAFILFVSMGIISCSSDDTETPAQLSDVTAELLSFTYTPQTMTTPERLQYEVRFTNPNDTQIRGFYSITTNAITNTGSGVEQLEASLLSTSNSPCYEIEANSSCTFSFDEEGNLQVSAPDSIEFVSAVYQIETAVE